MPWLRALLATLLLLACETAAAAPEPQGRLVTHEAASYRVFTLDLAHVNLTLIGQRPNEPFTFAALPAYLTAQHRELVVATNAGIFSPERRPMGLHIQDGEMLSVLSTADGEGNFFLKPNGVFWLDAKGAHVAASERYAPSGKVALATQSGPLLVERGRIHPKFSAASTSLKLRNAVGVDGRGRVHVVMSEAPVSFHALATLFRDVLHCPSALYLDGEISGLAAPGLPAPRAFTYGGLLVATRRAP